jgi:hypothetical protein
VSIKGFTDILPTGMATSVRLLLTRRSEAVGAQNSSFVDGLNSCSEYRWAGPFTCGVDVQGRFPKLGSLSGLLGESVTRSISSALVSMLSSMLDFITISISALPDPFEVSIPDGS